MTAREGVNDKKLGARVEKLLAEGRQASLTPNQILSELGLERHERSILLAELKRMLDKGLIAKTGRGRFGLPSRLGYLTGVLEGNRRGFAFLRPDLKSEDVYISSSSLQDAAHGDHVMIRLHEKKGARRREGSVIKVLKRGHSRLVGILQREGGRYLVIPDDRRFPGSVRLNRRDLKGARAGDKVLIEVHGWPRQGKVARGVMVETIGPAGSRGAEKKAFALRFELPGPFPGPVLEEAERLNEYDLSGAGREEDRRDLRGLQMVTIDDEQARDFDDAVSLEKLPGGQYRLGVHIADVSHFVREKKPLDREALKRGTSIYLPDRVIHMLPPALSENFCSLREKENRLAVSVFMNIDAAGELSGREFCQSLICVSERLSYQQAEAFFSNGSGEELFKDPSSADLLLRMDKLALLLRKRRLDRGALDLDLPEARITVDDSGDVVAVEKRSMGRSESLIEEFMIYCNETVAAFLQDKKSQCVYRVHAVPGEEKLAQLRLTLARLGIDSASARKELKARHLKNLLAETRGHRNEKLVSYLLLRSLPQAVYSPANEGHFGLASPCYCHFTSPIRRYPDLLVHRFLKRQLKPFSRSGKKDKLTGPALSAMALHCSVRERAAAEAERAAADIKKAEYMANKLGEVYPGIINGVTGFGIFVELENTVEGMIPLTDLKDDYYRYDEEAASLVGERTRKTYRLGDSIEIRVVRVNREEGKITFTLPGA